MQNVIYTTHCFYYKYNTYKNIRNRLHLRPLSNLILISIVISRQRLYILCTFIYILNTTKQINVLIPAWYVKPFLRRTRVRIYTNLRRTVTWIWGPSEVYILEIQYGVMEVKKIVNNFVELNEKKSFI